MVTYQTETSLIIIDKGHEGKINIITRFIWLPDHWYRSVYYSNIPKNESVQIDLNIDITAEPFIEESQHKSDSANCRSCIKVGRIGDNVAVLVHFEDKV